MWAYPSASVSHANQPEIRYLYTKTGQVDTMWYPRINTKTAYKYNHRKWLDTLIATRGANDIFREYLTFDATGQIIKQNSKQGTGSWLPQNYEYDVLGQLTRWLHDSGTGSQAGEDYTYDSVGNRLNLYFENNTGTITSWRNYDIGRRTDTSAGPNQMLKGTNRNFFTIFDYTTYTYDPDGSQSRRKLYTGAGLQLDEQFEYSSWRGLSSKYTRTDPNLLSGSDTWEYRYRYNAMGEREQKRETLNPAGDGTAANGYSWSYYLIGGNKKQISVWEGLQTSDATFCSLPGGAGSYVHLYPSEYLSYGNVSVNLITKPTSTSSTQEYFVTDHLGSNRVVLNSSGTVLTKADYEPFGKPLSGSTEDRKSFIDKERDGESQLGNFGVRSYDYDGGRFTSIDPLWQELNRFSAYTYSHNNPVNMIDGGGFTVDPKNLTESELKNYKRFKESLRKWALQSPTVKKIYDNAYGPESTIHLYGFSHIGLKSGQENTMSQLFPNLGTPLDNLFNRNAERKGLTLRLKGDAPMVADVMLNSDETLFFNEGEDDGEFGEIVLLDELDHSTVQPHSGTDMFDHMRLYQSLLNEVESGVVDLSTVYPSESKRSEAIQLLKDRRDQSVKEFAQTFYPVFSNFMSLFMLEK